MEDEKKKRKKSKYEVEVNPELEGGREIRVEESEPLDETLSRMGRIRLARSMKRSNKSGKLRRGKRKKQAMAMTVKRASGLGWRGARRSIKRSLSGGNKNQTAAEKSRIEKIADKRKHRQVAISRVMTRKILTQSYDPVNEAFEVMLEGKRYHQLLNKDGTVKFDMRFKHFKGKKAETEMTKEQFVATVSEMFDAVSTGGENVMLTASLIALRKLAESQSEKSLDQHALTVSKTFGTSVKDILGAYHDAY